MSISTNFVKVKGFLKRKNVVEAISKTGKEYMMIDLTIALADDKEVTVSMFGNRLSSNGNTSKIWEGMNTIKNEYLALSSTYTDKRANKDAKPVQMEATTVSSLEETDFVYVNKGAKLTMNRYIGQDGQLNQNFRITSNFVNRAKEGDDKTPYIEGSLTGVILSNPIEGEDTNGEFIKLSIAVPEYREAYAENPEKVVIEKFDLVLRDVTDEAVSYIESEFAKDVVANISIEPVHKITVIETQTEDFTGRGFGRIVKNDDKQTKVIRELQIIGGFSMNEDEYESEKAFDYELYQAGLKDFEDKINEMKADKVEVKEVKRGFGRTTSGSDLPF